MQTHQCSTLHARVSACYGGCMDDKTYSTLRPWKHPTLEKLVMTSQLDFYANRRTQMLVTYLL